MNIKLFLSKEKLTHKRITVKDGSSFHRAPKPVWEEIRPCKNQTTKWFSPPGTHISVADPPALSGVCISQAFFIQGREGCLNQKTDLKAQIQPHCTARLCFFHERAQQLPTPNPTSLKSDGLLNPQQFRKIQDTHKTCQIYLRNNVNL